MRTGLAILGIIIGIGSVIALLSLGEATQQWFQIKFNRLGANLLTVVPTAHKQEPFVALRAEEQH